ncbi:alkaline phosphatase family protein [Nocardioides panaciterrulae]|uniref:Acid phosphatase n=1 Tax=Nocardioides panaciterrulae TaxID=661492 RepID=A0A7Y9E649_9ACTN|nr:alkaline phosphatase family protein [Nocardioides panaciterrulae]NYD41804.1 acid phosphatase [Nocardioides panaciterrulae]
MASGGRRRARWTTLAAGVLALALATAGCATADDAGSSRLTAATRSARATSPVTKLVVVMVENHSLAQMRSGMPWTFRQAKRFGYATDYHAIRHPSLPNYLAIAGGSTFGVTDDQPPADHPVSGRSVFGQALAAGRTATVYAEGMPGRCSPVDGGHRYAVRHNPWTYFVDERRGCRHHDRPMSSLAADAAAGDLPNAGMVVPNTCHDAHDCGLAVADRWMKHTLRTLRSGPDWSQGRLAIVVTADEDDRHSGNRVLTVVLHPGVRHVVVKDRLTHYSLTRLYDEVLGTPYLRKARHAPSMATAFGLTVGG